MNTAFLSYSEVERVTRACAFKDKGKEGEGPSLHEWLDESGFNYANPPAKYPMTEKRMYIIPTKT